MFKMTNEGKRLALDSIRRELAGVACNTEGGQNSWVDRELSVW